MMECPPSPTKTPSPTLNESLCNQQTRVVPSVAKKIGKKLLREVFSKFFGHAGAPMHKRKNWGHRDICVVKFFGWCDGWSSKKRKKTKIAETVKISVKIDKNQGFR